MIKVISLYFVIINVISYFCMFADKKKAINGKWRISESFLISLSILGGSLGIYCGMKAFRHKTKHPKFYLGVPLIFIIQVILAIYLIYNFI